MIQEKMNNMLLLFYQDFTLKLSLSQQEVDQSITVVKHQISTKKQNMYRYLSMKFPTIKQI